MTLSEAPGNLKKFRRTAWRFQQTFQTPLQSLPEFVNTIGSTGQPLRAGCLTIEQAVFEPTHLIGLLNNYSIPPRYGRGVALTARGAQEVTALLQAALGDWVDFIFVPEPKRFSLYADHDEYTTFFAQTRSHLNRLVEALTGQGFRAIQDYERRF